MKNKLLRIWRCHAVRIAVIGTAIIAVQAVTTETAFADGSGLSGAFGPLQQVMQAIVDFIRGPFGKSLATVAVIGLGFLAFAGRLSWFTAGAVILGFGLVFGSTSIVDQLYAIAGGK